MHPESLIKKTVLNCDLTVIGGGLAGVCAALAAARNGLRVVLAQDRSVLGGNASSEVKMHVVGADCHGHRPGTRETGLIEELRLDDSARNPQRAFPLWDLLLYEKVKENPNITLLLDTACHGCRMEPGEDGPRIAEAWLRRSATEEEFIVRAPFFADCSGDGRLGAEAGADHRLGREARSEYGESFALPEADRKTLGCSILFTAKRHDAPQPFLRPEWVRRFRKDDFRFRPVHGFEYGYWWAEWGGHLDTIRDNDTIRHELLRIALGIWDYVKNSGAHPDSANWALDWIGALPGKRESRRFLGDHVLTQHDCETGRLFDDQVAYGGWWLDLHPPAGVDAPDEPPCVQHHLDGLYSIPLRSLYSRNVANLFFAGRNISATHVAFASTRVMATCAVMGQAIGTAAAILERTRGGRSPKIRSLATPDRIRDIQQALLRDDAFLLGVESADPRDRARKGKASASSEALGAPAKNVLNGIARSTQAAWGPWSIDAGNRWESRELPAWLEVELPVAATIAGIDLTFCSGLERQLMLSPSDHASAKSLRGPQPEIVRDYDLSIDGKKVLSVRGNVLRKRRHVLPSAVAGARVRIDVLATHGLPAARLFELRVYSDLPG